MTSVYAQLPGVSLAAGALLSGPMVQFREKQLRSWLQPPGWVFLVAWTLQAVSLGFVGQGLSETNDTAIKIMWTIWTSLLGPTQALSTWMRGNPSVPLRDALLQDVLYVLGLFVYLILIAQRLYQLNAKYNWLIWPSVGWIAFALVLVTSAQASFEDRVQQQPMRFRGGHDESK